MEYLVAILIGVLTGVAVGYGLIVVNRRSRSRYEYLIELLCGFEETFERHVREHILREKDWSWGIGVSPIATFGIKEDFTLMTDEELNEARRMAARRLEAEAKESA